MFGCTWHSWNAKQVGPRDGCTGHSKGPKLGP